MTARETAATDAAGRRRRLAVVTALGFASGLPLALTDSTLQAWLAVSDIDIETIGLFSLFTVPYVLKFVWAPLLDRYVPPLLGRRRGWILASQLASVALLLGLAAREPAAEISLVAWLALLLAFASATQDIAIDAYRAEILPAPDRGIGAGLSVAAYRVATVVSGAGAFVFADRFGFNAAYAAAAVMMSLGVFATLLAREPISPQPRGLREALVEPFREFFRRPQALWFVGLIVVYKLGDAAAARLAVTFLVRALEYSLSEIGALYKGLGFAASLVGGILGGLCTVRWGLYRSLLAFAFLQAVTNLGFAALAHLGGSLGLLIAVVGLENLSGGMGTAAFVALLMALCDHRYTATQFALLTGVASLGRVLSGPPAGVVVDTFGWTVFFIATVLVVIPVWLVLVRLREPIAAMDGPPRESAP